jgi:hypothetical protein
VLIGPDISHANDTEGQKELDTSADP